MSIQMNLRSMVGTVLALGLATVAFSSPAFAPSFLRILSSATLCRRRPRLVRKKARNESE